MLVEHLVFFVLLLFVDLRVFLAFPFQVRLPGAFGTDSTQRDHFLKIFMVARGAFRRW
jgi:hypothetical protein